MTVTAKRNNLRLIAVVLGEKEGKVRNNETMELLNYGYDNYKIDMIKSKDEVIKNIPINKGNKSSVNIFLKNDLSILSKKSDKDIKYDYEIKVNDIDLPIKSGEIVGKINLLNNKKIIKSEDLIIKEDLKKINIFKYILNKLIEVI